MDTGAVLSVSESESGKKMSKIGMEVSQSVMYCKHDSFLPLG